MATKWKWQSAVLIAFGFPAAAAAQPAALQATSFTFTSSSAPLADFTNANGSFGDVSGWGGYRYGNNANTLGFLRFDLNGTNTVPFTWRPRKNDGVGLTAGAPNFNPTPSSPYSFTVFEPRNNGTGSLNTVADIRLFIDGNQVANTDANLNAVLKFNKTTFFDWAPDASLPAGFQGDFTFAFAPDSAGTPNRVIVANYTPVPEPAALLGVAAIGVLGVRAARRRYVRARAAS